MLIPLVKINIIAEKNAKNAILNLLQEKSVMEISELKEQDRTEKKHLAETETPTYFLNRLKTAINLLLPCQKKKSIKETMETAFNPGVPFSKKEIEEVILNFDREKTVDRLLEIQKEINLRASIIAESKNNLKSLVGWENINFAPKEIETLKNFKMLLGSVPGSVFLNKKSEENKFLKNLGEKTKNNFALEIISATPKETKIAITFPKEYEKKTREILTAANFKEASILYPEMKPSDAIKNLENTMEDSEKTLSMLNKELKKIARKNLKNLYLSYDYLFWEIEKQTNGEKISTSRYLFSLDGWMEGKNIPFIETEISRITKNFIITRLKISAKEQQPVILRNSLFEPYEAVTNIYGLPLPNEPDPTPFLAPFFTIFFAFALTDAGYGIVLLALCWLMIKFLKIPKEKQKLFKVLILGSIATIIMGALFGGWFGVVPKDLPDSFGALKNFLVKIQVIDPVANPMAVMFLAFIMGIIQIWFGILVSVWWHFKKGDWKKALMDYAVWDFLLAAIIFWLAADKLALLPSMAIIAKYILFAALGAIIITQGRARKNIILKFGVGVISLYGLVNYLGDVLSYSRLLALGLATGIIAMVINLVAMIFKDMAPFGWMGWIVAGMVLVGGHLFNIVINVLGAFIHSGRLQYVEFFPKFMEGGGRRFKPFSRKNNYIRVIS